MNNKTQKGNSISIDKVLSEIYRRLNYFHSGNLDTKLLLLSTPSKAKELKDLNIITPHGGRETARVLNWYSLTDFGKEYFREYITDNKLSDKTNSEIFSQQYVKRFKRIK